MAQAFTGGGKILFNFAHIYGNVFVFARFRNAKMEPHESGRGYPSQSHLVESIIAITASRSARGVAC
jgi:hypothetical protein